jgi:uncharacterized protein
MAKRKPTRKKRRSKKPRKKTPFKSPLFKAVAGVAIVAVLVVAIGFLIYELMPPKASFSRAPKAKEPSATRKPVFEIYPKDIKPPRKPLAKKDIPRAIPKPELRPLKKLPSVAIIIDDLGYDKNMAEKFAQLDAALTFSILPYSPFQKKISGLARSRDLEVMLHLPMEPVEYPEVNPGPGTLLTSMTPDELIRQLEQNIAAVPDAKGVNNHMGSKLTTESTQMYQIFSVLKQRGLFFVDSRTTADSICEPSARLFQVPFAQRDVFIDHYQTPGFIRKQIKELIRIAELKGEAVGIMHPHTTTLRILQEMLPDLKKHVQLVPVSKITHPAG